MSQIEGELQIYLHAEPEKGCEIQSSRPHQASRILHGKSCESVLRTVHLLFSLCRQAQTTASVRAIEQAQQRPAPPQVETQRNILVLLENLREQSWGILKHWPPVLQQPPAMDTLRRILQWTTQLQNTLNPAQQLYGLQAQTGEFTEAYRTLWRDLKQCLQTEVYSPDGLDLELATSSSNSLAAQFLHHLRQQDWQNAGATKISHYPLKTDDLLQLRTQLNVDFIAQPHWQGQVLENSYFSQLITEPLIQDLIAQRGNGLYTRSVARVLGIHRLIEKIDRQLLDEGSDEVSSCACYDDHGWGIAQVTAARGQLVHAVKLSEDQQSVQDYRLLAPTEWNFRPNGVVAQSLQQLYGKDRDSDTLQADLLIQAIDPCVGYTLHWEHCH